MKKKYFLNILLVLSILSLNAQFTDDFENCNVGLPITTPPLGDWGCGGGPGCAMMCSDTQAHSGTKSGHIPADGTTDALLDLGNKIFGDWTVSFYMYVPSNRSAYFNLQGTVPVVDGQWIVGNIEFNEDLLTPGVATIDMLTATTDDDFTFNFPHDQWFRVIMNFDINLGITLATWSMSVDGAEVVPQGTALKDGSGASPNSLGGINFWSCSTECEFFIDDLCFGEANLNCANPTESLNDLSSKEFLYYPNPIKNQLNLKANQAINSVIITNTLGQIVHQSSLNTLTQTINMSKFNNGVYFVKINIDDTEGVIKIIK